MKILATDIAGMHPKGLRSATDHYYARVANEIVSALHLTLAGRESKSTMYVVALKLTMYLEDIVSDAGIWGTFTKLYRHMYGRSLPFYDVPADFSTEDISLESVNFLIWLFMANEREGTLLNPDNPGMREMAKMVLPVLRRYRRTAPVNEELLDMLYSDETLDDFMEIKSVLMWLLDTCYLSEWWGTEEKIGDVADQIDEVGTDDLSLSKLHYASLSICAFTLKGTLLALLPQQWYAEMLRWYNAEDFAATARDIEAIRHFPFDVFRVDGHDECYVRLTSVDGEQLQVRWDSLGRKDGIGIGVHKTLLTALAQWKGEWNVIGMSFWQADEETYNAYKEAWQKDSGARLVLPPDVLEKLNGRRLFFFKTYDECAAWAKDLIGAGTASAEDEHIREMTDILVFIEDNGSLSLIPKDACGVKSADNPLYDPDKAPDCALNLLLSSECSTPAMSRYLAAHGLLPDASLNSLISPERGRQLIQENMDFWARCIRRCDY